MKIDHIHFYVEDAIASSDWFVNCMGFHTLASGASDHTQTAVVKSGTVTIVLSSPLTAASPVTQFLRRHPPGVADIAFVVADLAAVMARAVTNGAQVLVPIQQQQLAQGSWKWGKIAAWGSLSHTLIECTNAPALLPGFFDGEVTTQWFSPTQSWEIALVNSPCPTGELGLFTGIDHVVLNVAAGDLERALSWYEAVLGFQRQQRFMIQTENSGLSSQVMVHPDSGVQFPINEPTSANSQIQEFLEVNQGPGIQHIALQTPQIVKAIAKLRDLGLSFLPVPGTYYTQLSDRHQGLHLSPAELAEVAAQQILVDWQEASPQALLLQIFTQPIFPEPTFFFELIERRAQAQGFGEGNFRALFEAIEREQLQRGSLGIQ